MNLKIHIIIITCIIAALFVLWQVFIVKTPETKSVVVSSYAIEIARASYGLACLDYKVPGSNSGQSGPYQDVHKQEDKLKENNVLLVVSQLCNGKPKCSFEVDPDELGGDPAPYCGLKDLQVEFRCYTLDRLRKLSFSSGSYAVIDCGKIIAQP